MVWLGRPFVGLCGPGLVGGLLVFFSSSVGGPLWAWVGFGLGCAPICGAGKKGFWGGVRAPLHGKDDFLGRVVERRGACVDTLSLHMLITHFGQIQVAIGINGVDECQRWEANGWVGAGARTPPTTQKMQISMGSWPQVVLVMQIWAPI